MGIRDYDRDSICKLCVAANALMRGSIETLFHNFNALNEGKLRQETALSYWCIVRNCELTLIENIHLHLYALHEGEESHRLFIKLVFG